MLTDEQRERMEQNRQRALEIRKRKLEQETKKEELKVIKEPSAKKAREEEEKAELEEFEVNASEFVTKTEAMKMYCLPEGTLAVCQVVEKQNPRHKGWTPMKLYYRSEIRRRARERHGGMEGLIRERKKRAQKRFEKDLERSKDLFG